MAAVRQAVRRHPLLFGFGLMFLLTWPVELWRAAASRGWTSVAVPEPLALFVGWGFVVAALVLTALADGRAGLRELGSRLLRWRVGWRWYLVALFGFAVIDLLAVLLASLWRGEPPAFDRVFAQALFGPSEAVWVFVLPFLLFDAVSNGEELGWRGYALPRLLQRHNALVASLVLGVVWAVWHLPKFLVVGGTHEGFHWFLLDVLAKAVLFTWLYNHTRGSLLLAILFHASINTSAVFLPVMAAVSGDDLPFALGVVLKWLWVAAVVASQGARYLSRDPWAAESVRQPG